MQRILPVLPVMFRMAVRGLLRQKKRSAIVAATAAVGILTVTVSQGFINGFTDSLVSVAVDTGLGHAQIRPAGYLDSRQMDLLFPNARRVEERFRGALPPDVRYAPRMEREAILRMGSETRGVLLLGIDPGREAGVSGIPSWPIDGRFLANEPDGSEAGQGPSFSGVSCLLGGRMSRLLDAEVNGHVILSTGTNTGATRSFACRIRGIYHSPSSALEESLVIMSLSDLARIRNDAPSDEVGYFVFRGADLSRSAALARTLRERLVGEKGIEVASMGEMEPLLADMMEFYDSVTWIFYFAILAGFGIVLFESVTMSIFERTHEIGIMHAIGSPPPFLFGLVTTESVMLTLAGTVVGIAGGAILVGLLYKTGFSFSASTLDTRTWGATAVSVVYPFLKGVDLAQSIVVAVAVGMLSTIYPARKAVRMSPIEAIYRR